MIGPIRRRTIDSVLIAAGAVVALVLVAAGGLLTWGSNFADDYVGDELAAQNIFFPDQAALEEDGHADLVQYAGEQVTTGSEAEAYASYIDGHLAGIADGATYADLGAVSGPPTPQSKKPKPPGSTKPPSPTSKPTPTPRRPAQQPVQG